MVARALVLVSALVLAALVACGGRVGCGSGEVAADVAATSAANPWYSGGVLVVEIEEGRESDRQPVTDELKNCEGVAVFGDGSRRPMDYRISYTESGELSGVGFDYEGREGMTIPKSEWEAGRRE